jgi:hypothetical protein
MTWLVVDAADELLASLVAVAFVVSRPSNNVASCCRPADAVMGMSLAGVTKFHCIDLVVP